MECFFYVVGIVHHPDYGFCREKLTQVGMLIATIDDVYDVYGSLEELELFTQIIDRFVSSSHFLPFVLILLFLLIYFQYRIIHINKAKASIIS